MSAAPKQPTSFDAARDALALGIHPVPIKPGTKRPPMRAWQNLRLEIDDLQKQFNNGNGIGWLLGIKPRPVADVDIDSAEALAIAPLLAGPKTGRISGRASKRASHYFYELPDEFETEQFKDPLLVERDKKSVEKQKPMLIELRGKGGQTVVPPSVHESGEPIRWEHSGELGKAPHAELLQWVSRIASGALLVRYWTRGHETRQALAGMLARGGWPEADTAEFVCAVVRAAQPDTNRQEVRSDVKRCYERLERGEELFGRKKLEELLGEHGKLIASQFAKWLNLAKQADGTDLDELNARGERFAVEQNERYVEEGGRLCSVTFSKKGERSVHPLCNFTARITEHVTLDDGLEPLTAHMASGKLETGRPLPPARVLSSEFGSLNWITKNWSACDAIMRSGFSTRDELREAIQIVSMGAPSRHVFTHTGWREVGGRHLFLHGAGALGGEQVEVELPQELRRYQLPAEPQDVAGAMRESLNLLRIAPLSVTVPLWGAIFRAPFASIHPLDLSLWLEGVTGSMKSTLAALFLCHFGEFNRTSLPGAWSSTANQLEKRAFVLKDLPFVVDDFAPSGLDLREMEAKAGRLVRSQGNIAGRARLRSDLSDRPAYAPRGFIISTGEQRPPGASLLARMVVVEINREEIVLKKLSEAQQAAGRLPHAMSGFLSWAGARFGELRKELASGFEDARRDATAEGEHLRVPEAIANLWLGFDFGMQFAKSCGACSSDEAETLRDAAWSALLKIGRNQGKLVEAEKPSRRFLSVLLTLVQQEKAVLLEKSSKTTSCEKQIGWQDADFFYLMPEAAFQAVAQFCRDSGELFATRPEALRRDLAREELLELDEGRYTRSVRLGGRVRKVLQVRRPKAEELVNGAEAKNGE